MASQPQQTNVLGNVSLALGIASAVFVFGIGLCALVGLQQSWIRAAATPLYICGATSAFIGFVGAVLGAAGLFGANRSRAAAIVGLVFGLIGICLFFTILSIIGQAA